MKKKSENKSIIFIAKVFFIIGMKLSANKLKY